MHKGGNTTDINNYRGISVLPPLAKIFEKILANQIIFYLNANKILFSGQHGFRPDHSCETALHELITDLNMIRDRNEIGVCLLKLISEKHLTWSTLPYYWLNYFIWVLVINQ